MTRTHGSLLALLTIAMTWSACSGPEQDGRDMSDAMDMNQTTDMPSPTDQGGQDDGGPDMSAPDMSMTTPDDMPPASDMSSPDLANEEMGEDDMRAPDMAQDMSQGGEPAPGFGELSGDCDVIDAELDTMESYFFLNELDFAMDGYDEADFMQLSMGGQEIVTDGNAGGNSLYSEVFAYEVLYRCEEAILLKTETEIVYQNPMGKITDLLVEIDGKKVGVSVVRAIAFPFEDPYPLETARTILTKKLEGIQESSANVAEEDRWVKQILSVIAYTDQHAMQIRVAYDELSADLKGDTILLVTVTEGDDGIIFNTND